jgi:hypothetical protein
MGRVHRGTSMAKGGYTEGTAGGQRVHRGYRKGQGRYTEGTRRGTGGKQKVQEGGQRVHSVTLMRVHRGYSKGHKGTQMVKQEAKGYKKVH